MIFIRIESVMKLVFRRIIFISISCSLFFMGVVKAQESRYAIEAAFIQKISRFVEWPFAKWYSNKKHSFTISILGDSPILENLQMIASSTKINEKKILIKKLKNIRELGRTNILFISKDQKKRLDHILSSVEGKNILTISDTPGFGEKGVMINFYQWKTFIRFEINLKVLGQTDLVVSSRLLRVARIIE